MTWIIPKNLHTSPFVQDTEELISDLNESSQICAQSLLVRSKPTRSRTWFQKWKRDSWTRLLYGRILKPSLGKVFAERWTSSQAASLVNPSQLRAVEEEMKILDTSSHTSSEESHLSDLPLFSLRTSKESSPPSSEKDGVTEQERPFSFMSSVNWKGWVTKRRQEYLARAKSAHLINERESLLWLTPCATEIGTRSESSILQRIQNKKQEELLVQIYRETSFQVEKESLKKNGPLLKLWASPRTGMSKAPAGGGDPNKKAYHFRIENQVKTSFQVEEEKLKRNGSQREQLNPRWVETLMGVPIGWTMATCANPYVIEPMNSDSSVTGSSLQQQQEPSKSFGEKWATPNTFDYLSLRSDEALIRQATTTRKGRTSPSNLREQVDPYYCEKWNAINKKDPN